MNVKDWFEKAPCACCSYKLGLVRTLVNPCPQCLVSRYSTFQKFVKKLGESRRKI